MKLTVFKRISILAMALILSYGLVPSVAASPAGVVEKTTEAQLEVFPGELALLYVPSFQYADIVPISKGNKPLAPMIRKGELQNKVVVGDGRADGGAGWALKVSIEEFQKESNGSSSPYPGNFAVTLTRPSPLEIVHGPALKELVRDQVPVYKGNVKLTATPALFVSAKQGVSSAIQWKFPTATAQLTVSAAQTVSAQYQAKVNWVLEATA